MTKEFFLTIAFVAFILAGMCWPSEAVARGGCASCQAGSCQAEAPVVATMPDQAKSVCPTCPAARAAAKATVTVAKAPIVAVECSRERRASRGGWFIGKWVRGGCCR